MKSKIIANEKKTAQQWLAEIKLESASLANALARLPPVWTMLPYFGLKSKTHQEIIPCEHYPNLTYPEEKLLQKLKSAVGENYKELDSCVEWHDLLDLFARTAEGETFIHSMATAAVAGNKVIDEFFQSAESDCFCYVFVRTVNHKSKLLKMDKLTNPRLALASLATCGGSEVQAYYHNYQNACNRYGTPSLSLDETLKFHRIINNSQQHKRRKPQLTNKKKPPIGILTHGWLAFSLWKKNYTDILTAIPLLSTGSDQESFYRDIDSIKKTIQRHKLPRVI